MQEYSLMEKFADPALFDSLNLGEKLAGSGITMLMGMGTTFVVLILLWGLIALMAKFIAVGSKPKAVPAAVAPAAISAPAPALAAPAASGSAAVPAGMDPAIVAVIMAAISASEGPEMASRLVVRRINRIAGPATTWSSAGSSDCIASRKM